MMNLLKLLMPKLKEGPRVQHEVTVLSEGVKQRAHVVYYPLYSTRFREGSSNLELMLKDGSVFHASAYDYFSALGNLRKQLEESDRLILVWGAHRHVWPSGMEGDMGGGLEASLHDIEGEPLSDSRFILDEAEKDEVWLTEQENEYHKRIANQQSHRTASTRSGGL